MCAVVPPQAAAPGCTTCPPLHQMAMETSNMDPAAHRTHVLHWIDVGTTVAFGLEAVLKIVAFGFRPYFAFNSNKVGV